MAFESVQIQTATGPTIAVDNISGIRYQRAKLASGVADSTTAIAAGGEVVNSDANALQTTRPKINAIRGTDINQASAITSAQLRAADTARMGMCLTNTDANAAYLYYGTTASLTKFTVRIPSNGYWEMPLPIYTGRIDCIWAGDGSGALIGNEL